MLALRHRKAITNGQRSYVSYLLLQLSNSFLRILAMPNKAVFCNKPVLMVTPSFWSHASNLLLTTRSAPTTTVTTSRCLILHSLPISLFRSWYFSIYSLPFSNTLWSQGEPISTMIALLFSFSTITMSGLLASITWPHLVISHKILHFPFSTNRFRLMFIPFLTSAHVILKIEFPVHQSGNIVVSSLVLFLCQHLTLT